MDITVSEMYWSITKQYILSEEPEKDIAEGIYESFHFYTKFILSISSSIMKSYTDEDPSLQLIYIRENISIYEDQYNMLLEKADSKLGLLTLHLYIASVASLQADAPLSLNTKKIPSALGMFSYDEDNYLDKLVLITNHTGHFESEQFLSNYLNKLVTIGIPSGKSVADGNILTPIQFISHDSEHNWSFTPQKEVTLAKHRMILDSLIRDKEELLIHALCHIIHEDATLLFSLNKDSPQEGMYSDYESELVKCLTTSRFDKGVMDLSEYDSLLDKKLHEKYCEKYNIVIMGLYPDSNSYRVHVAIAMLDDYVNRNFS